MTAPANEHPGIYQHLAHEVSLYSGKTRAYLRYKKIPFEEQLSLQLHNRIKTEIGKKIVPVVVTPEGEYLQDTTVIIDRLEQRFPTPSVYPDTPAQKLVALLLELYGDEWLVMAAMHYRWQYKRYNLGFILEQFGDALKPHWPRWLKKTIALPMALFFGIGYRPLFGMNRHTQPEVEKSTEQFLKDFDRHLQDHDFLLGSRPSIGDFGLVAPLYAHLARDPYPKQLMQRIAPNVFAWTQRMQNPSGEDGEFLTNDEIPETLYPILQRMFTEQFPPLIDTLHKVADWVEKHPDQRTLPRHVGRHQFRLGDATAKRCAIPFQQWMFQRPLDFYQSLSPTDKEGIDPLMKQLGGFEGLQEVIPVRLDYLNHELVVSA
jgi:glutathione S-transferase